MKLESTLRKLARSRYWQELYGATKTCSGIYLFNNQINFSGIQVLFIYWLRVYSMLYDELAQLEWENLDNEVIKDDDRCDAFLYWRRKEIEKTIRQNKKEQRKGTKKEKQFDIPIFSGAKNTEKKEGDK